MPSVLLVCMGNICRSPTADGVLRKMAKERGIPLIVDSAGTTSAHAGERPDLRSVKAASERGYDLSEIRSRQVQSDDFDRFDHLLAMDEANLRDLRARCPEQHQHKLALFLEFGSMNQREVPDPYYGGGRGFTHVLDLVEDASRGFLDTLSAC